MKKSDLSFPYPESLVALKPQRPSRVMKVQKKIPSEISLQDLLEEVSPGDVWVINNTQVIPRRVWTLQGDLEILFLKPRDDDKGSEDPKEFRGFQDCEKHFYWEVLFPASRVEENQAVLLPGGVSFRLIERGLPQVIALSEPLTEGYFTQYGELPLPPYIQKRRQNRHQSPGDLEWYQTAWAKYSGSLASPTASLHFDQKDLQFLKEKGVHVLEITLHIGLGTFLPIKCEDLNQHQMHSEWVEIPQETWDTIKEAKERGSCVWALGTTVTRSLESLAKGYFQKNETSYFGETNLFIQPGFSLEIVDRLMTNFHQPESTLLALVAAFQDLTTVKTCYQWAIDKQFRLFSYGDLSVWDRDS
jgi:S-adenosylmethionine:tRNA ribosyltransferase-isomerase